MSNADDRIRSDFLDFAALAFETTNGAPMIPYPYMGLLAEKLARVARGKTRRLVVNLPPRHFKTWLGTICLSACILGHKPSAKIIVLTYGPGTRRQDRLPHPRHPAK
jgi:hypothetical protein